MATYHIERGTLKFRDRATEETHVLAFDHGHCALASDAVPVLAEVKAEVLAAAKRADGAPPGPRPLLDY